MCWVCLLQFLPEPKKVIVSSTNLKLTVIKFTSCCLKYHILKKNYIERKCKLKFHLLISPLGLTEDSSFREKINTYQYIIRHIHIINCCQVNYQVGSYFTIKYLNYFPKVADLQLTGNGLSKALSRYELKSSLTFVVILNVT